MSLSESLSDTVFSSSRICPVLQRALAFERIVQSLNRERTLAMMARGSFRKKILPWTDSQGIVGIPATSRSSFWIFRSRSNEGTSLAPVSLRIQRKTRISELEIRRCGKLSSVSSKNIWHMNIRHIARLQNTKPCRFSIIWAEFRIEFWRVFT